MVAETRHRAKRKLHGNETGAPPNDIPTGAENRSSGRTHDLGSSLVRVNETPDNASGDQGRDNTTILSRAFRNVGPGNEPSNLHRPVLHNKPRAQTSRRQILSSPDNSHDRIGREIQNDDVYPRSNHRDGTVDEITDEGQGISLQIRASHTLERSIVDYSSSSESDSGEVGIGVQSDESSDSTEDGGGAQGDADMETFEDGGSYRGGSASYTMKEAASHDIEEDDTNLEDGYYRGFTIAASENEGNDGIGCENDYSEVDGGSRHESVDLPADSESEEDEESESSEDEGKLSQTEKREVTWNPKVQLFPQGSVIPENAVYYTPPSELRDRLDSDAPWKPEHPTPMDDMLERILEHGRVARRRMEEDFAGSKVMVRRLQLDPSDTEFRDSRTGQGRHEHRVLRIFFCDRFIYAIKMILMNEAKAQPTMSQGRKHIHSPPDEVLQHAMKQKQRWHEVVQNFVNIVCARFGDVSGLQEETPTGSIYEGLVNAIKVHEEKATWHKISARISWVILAVIALSETDANVPENKNHLTQFIRKKVPNAAEPKKWTDGGLLRNLYHGVAKSPIEWLIPRVLSPDYHKDVSMARLSEMMMLPDALNDPARLQIELDIWWVVVIMVNGRHFRFDSFALKIVKRWIRMGIVNDPRQGQSVPLPPSVPFPTITQFNDEVRERQDAIVTGRASKRGDWSFFRESNDGNSQSEDTSLGSRTRSKQPKRKQPDDDSDLESRLNEDDIPSSPKRHTKSSSKRRMSRKKDEGPESLRIRRAEEVLKLKTIQVEPVIGKPLVSQEFMFYSPVVTDDRCSLTYKHQCFTFDVLDGLEPSLKQAVKLFDHSEYLPIETDLDAKLDVVRTLPFADFDDYPVVGQHICYSVQHIHAVASTRQRPIILKVGKWNSRDLGQHMDTRANLPVKDHRARANPTLVHRGLGAGSMRKMTIQDFLDHREEDIVVSFSPFPLIDVNIPPSILRLSDGHQLGDVFGNYVCKTQSPAGTKTCGLLTSKRAVSQRLAHTMGCCMWMHVALGQKLIFVPYRPLAVDELRREWMEGRWRLIHLKEGDTLFLRPGTPYVEVSIEDSLVVIGHFYCTSTYDKTLEALVMEHRFSNITNAADLFTDPSPVILFKVLARHVNTLKLVKAVEAMGGILDALSYAASTRIELSEDVPEILDLPLRRQFWCLWLIVKNLDILTPKPAEDVRIIWQETENFACDFAAISKIITDVQDEVGEISDTDFDFASSMLEEILKKCGCKGKLNGWGQIMVSE